MPDLMEREVPLERRRDGRVLIGYDGVSANLERWLVMGCS